MLAHARSSASARSAAALFQSRHAQHHHRRFVTSSASASAIVRPTITALLKCFDQLQPPGSSEGGNALPAPLLSRLRDYASRERTDVALLRRMPLPSQEEEYEALKVEVSLHINSLFRSQMKAATSEAAYSPRALDLYDAYVWGYNSPFLWRILQEECQELYDESVGGPDHCDVAVGTGLFLGNLDWGGAERRGQSLTLVDLNSNSLDACAERVQRAARSKGQSLQVEKFVADITDTNNMPDGLRGRYQSVGANFLIHCLHGDNILDKRSAFESCASLLSDKEDDGGGGGGCFFGSTILGKELLDDGVDTAGEAAVQTLLDYNKWGIFGNKGDTFRDLEVVLNETFEDVEVWRSGYCGVWKARKPVPLLR